ncbi:MAG: type II toxin-antitoxin system RelE/ParE family toxin [Defluviitaleaceae bacterium]|nr:type II toxin-antitoxin system RelE/ParE family toxin [Defluviitaleaceae bacterium]
MLDVTKYIITEYDAPDLAHRIANKIKSNIAELGFMPKRFSLVLDELLAQRGFRSIPVENYIIFYIVNENKKTVNIVSVMHNKRDWINLL